jgi:hypothetical protein
LLLYSLLLEYIYPLGCVATTLRHTIATLKHEHAPTCHIHNTYAHTCNDVTSIATTPQAFFRGLAAFVDASFPSGLIWKGDTPLTQA